MKRIRMFFPVFLLAAAALFVGCEKEQNDEAANTDTVVPDSEVNVNPEYVAIDWDAAAEVAADDSTGAYSIQFDAEVPDVRPGSIIAIDRDTVVLYRLVVSVEKSGNTMNIESVEATLSDIFHDTRFTLATSRSAKSAKGLVFYPMETYVHDGQGGYQALGKASKSDTRFTRNIWKAPLFDLDGQELAKGDNWALTLEKMNASLAADIEMVLNFGGGTQREMINELVSRYRSKTLEVSAALVGTFDTEQKIRFDAEGSFNYAPDYDIWKPNFFRPVTIKFGVPAGPIVIPVSITLRSDLFRQVAFSGSGKISAYMGFTDKAECRLGLSWSQQGGIAPYNSVENTFQLIPPTLEGKGQIQAKVWVFPRIRAMLYDRVGPSFDIMPWMADTVRGGFREESLGQSNDYCAWSLDHHAGVDLRMGWSQNHLFSGYEAKNNSTERLTCADVKIYHSPRKVVHVSGRPEQGQSGTVRFEVYDTNLLIRQAVKTVFPQIVRFEAHGDLSSEYGIASQGSVSVSWTPSGNDTLYAKLYDQDGNVMAFDTVIVGCDCNLTSGDWVDLGLPSGLLWATRNVGASSPSGYGDYFAWGETSPKSRYDWENYRYFRSDDNGSGYTKYCPSSGSGYNGYTDNFTTLQPADDAATANYGGRMPTASEWEELYNNTTSKWTTIDGVNGRCFTGRNGGSLFLPAAGYRGDAGSYGVGDYGDYWSSSLDTGSPYFAWYFGFHSGYVYWYSNYYRIEGRSVRAVRAAR